tara:strand:+ start:156 stop:488 length:333 start_codon:yes stop_codon:yes gene_type:complete
MTRARDLSDSVGKPRVIHYKLSSAQQYFLIDHVSGNIDVFKNGLLLLPQISDNTGTLSNLSSSNYEYQSGTAADTLGTNWSENSTAESFCTAIKLSSSATSGNKISIRCY